MVLKRFKMVGLVLVVGLVGVMPHGGVVSANNSWLNYHWERSSNPLPLSLGSNFADPQWMQYFNAAVTDWDVSPLDLTTRSGGTSPRRCKADNGMIEVCADSYGNNGWLGIAQIWVDGDHIVRATAKMNDFYYAFDQYNTYAWRRYVMCQEIGHDFGLGHRNENVNTNETASCMEYVSDPAGNISPDQHDYNELGTIYTHGDAGADPAPEPDPNTGPCRGGPKRGCAPPAFDMELTDVGQWGQLIATSSNGGQSTFVQDFGNGYRAYTHVTWTLEVAQGLRGGR